MKIYAVVPTHNRHTELAELLRSIPPDVHVLVIDNASEPAVQFNLPLEFLGRRIQFMRDEEQPPNLSRLWNVGLDWAQKLFATDDWARPGKGDDWAVAILNDDVVLPSGLLDGLAYEMQSHDVDIAFPAPAGAERCDVNTDDPFPGVGRRLTGWCFMVRGSSGLRADESLRWWCGDDDLQAQAVRNGRGTVGVVLPPVMRHCLVHRYPDQSTTGVLREQTEKDMTTFVEKWGQRPW